MLQPTSDMVAGTMKKAHLVKVVAKRAFALADRGLKPMSGPRILIYHQVGANLGREMEVSTRAFRSQLEWLSASGGTVVDLETAIARRNEPGSDKLFVLTFDDGFEDVYDNAFPLMRDRRLPFTLYLTTQPIETGDPIDSRYPGASPLTWSQINEMIESGLVTVGSHTHTHPHLERISVKQIDNELDVSDSLIERRTGIKPRHFTYPWGVWSGVADPFVRARYETATVGSARDSSSNFDSHRMTRVPVQRTDVLGLFQRRMETGNPTETFFRDLANSRGKGDSS